MPDLSFERALIDDIGVSGPCPIAGLDEVGRGPWAGPVIACAVILPDPMADDAGLPLSIVSMIDDSKKLTAARRDALYDLLCATVPYGLGSASAPEIDTLNILQASLLAMRRALSALPVPVMGALVDGNRDPRLCLPTRLIVKGDSHSLSIAAASIIAKVHRDRLMGNLARDYPGYGWDRNMGYGTKAHQDGLKTLGVTPHHRKSFAPIRARLENDIKI
ncbi:MULTISPECIES: ribonuclease HII [unclassified Hwanghaeella]|jgi:ribonuclease HII|uniref:ribonuclease HII n=1 Tax=unclassified Hwanghaeella TaxID=2605944 RepID=UPI000C91583E|nr:ribonuclease HII [Rhodospirillales bacterium]|tara:strand:+ start:5323 stop:5979 length:657 start_codon:yes stop_codon:yes gene_type:complete